MTAEDPSSAEWRELRALLETALEASPEDRRALLADAARNDPGRADRLVELLRADAWGGSPLDDGIAAWFEDTEGFDSARRPSAERGLTGRRLGPWQIGEPIGSGGMGVVYAATRSEGDFVQEAAVKVLRHGADRPTLQRRFRLERRLLASLEHPSIVRLLDGGLTDGVLWFALERVEGEPITAFARERGLLTPERIDLFLGVCDAVEEAHRRLIVHRDLKPSNILVTRGGVPKLLDFGIAKLLEDESGEHTRTDELLLTPQYAAPEQLLGEPPTTAVDVYSLGVVLYELLTGESPHDRRSSSPAALARQLDRETAPLASRRVAESQPGARRLARELAGDLDAILVEALQREPRHRYPSVAALAADLRRHRQGLPVGARSGGWRYRAGSFVRRHRIGVLSAALVTGALLVGAVGVAWQGRIASAERDRARLEAEKARQVAAFMAEIFRNADPARTRGARMTAREVLVAGADRVRAGLVDPPEVRISLLLAIGTVERDLGLYAEAKPLLEEALATSEALYGPQSSETATALHELGALDRFLDRLDEGRDRLERALALREQLLGPDHLEVGRTLAALGAVLRQQGDSEAARDRFERALAISRHSGVESDDTGRWLNSLGLVLFDVGDYRGAEAAYRQSLEVLERSAGPDNPSIALPLDNLGMLLRAEERFDEALPLLERAARLVETTWGADHLQYGIALNSLGVLLSNLHRCDQAVPLLERSAAVFGSALAPDHRYVAFPLIGEGDCLLELGQPAIALEHFERASAIREASTGAHVELATSIGRVGLAQEALGRLDEAEASYRRSLAMLRETSDPESPGVAEAMVDLAALLRLRGQREEPGALYREALVVLRKAYPGGHSYVDRVEEALRELGEPVAALDPASG